MKSGSFPHPILLFLALAASSGAYAAPPAQTAQPNMRYYNRKEENARTVDQVALATKKRAIQTMLPLLQSRANTPEEPVLMVRVMELEYDAADIEFRIANGKAARAHTAPDLTNYRAYIKTGEQLAGEFIRRYPKDPQLPRVYYLRARGLGEIGNKDEAIADLRAYIDHYSNPNENQVAVLGLCDMLIEKKDYPTAIQYLNRLIRDPRQDTYSLALDRLAWVEYFLNDIPSAMTYLGYEMRHFNEHPNSKHATLFQREKVLDAMTLFYATAMEQRKPGFDAQAGYKYLASMARPGAQLSKCLVSFAYLLRGKGLDSELEALKMAVLADRPPGVDLMAVVAVAFENQLNRKRYAQLTETAKEMYGLMTAVDLTEQEKQARSKKAISTLTDAAVELQVTFSKNKNDLSYARGVAISLTTIYDLLLKINAGNDATCGKIHFNLAEIFFHFKDYPNSAAHYRWVVEHASFTWPKAMKKLAADAKLKAISAYYEFFRAQKFFPDDLKTKSLAETKHEPVAQDVALWLKWMDDYASSNGLGPTIDNFIFEGNRLIYSRGHIALAVDRLKKFIAAAPKSQYAIPSASLVIDTYIATQNWDDTYQMAISMLKQQEWNGTPFATRLAGIAGDAYFKRIEGMYKKQQYQDALKGVDQFLTLYPKSRFHQDSLELGANAALAIDNKPLAMQYFQKLASENGLKGELAGSAHLTAAAVAEDQYDLAKASSEYEAYIAMPENANRHDPGMLEKRKRILLLAWISGSQAQLNHVLRSPRICSGQLAAQCEQFKLMAELSRGARVAWRDDPSRRRDVLWIVAGFSSQRQLPLKRKLQLVDQLASQWGKQDPVITYSLMAHLNTILPRALRHMRAEIRKSTPLKLDKRSIAARTVLIEQMEGVAGKLANSLPFVRLKVTALNEVANLYQDFANDLKAIPPPRGLTAQDLKTYQATVAQVGAPFRAKGDSLRSKALSMASDSGVDYPIFMDVARRAFVEQPELKTALGKGHPDFTPGENLDLQKLAEILTSVPKDKTSPLRDKLARAIHSRKLPMSVYLVQEAGKRNLLDSGELHLAKALVFDMAGARAEALAELDLSREELAAANRASVLAPLVAAYFETYAFDKTQLYLKELMNQRTDYLTSAVLGPSTGGQILAAAQWTSIKVPEEIALYLDTAATSGQAQRAPAGGN